MIHNNSNMSYNILIKNCKTAVVRLFGTSIILHNFQKKKNRINLFCRELQSATILLGRTTKNSTRQRVVGLKMKI